MAGGACARAAPRSTAPICSSPASRRSSSPGTGPTASRAIEGDFCARRRRAVAAPRARVSPRGSSRRLAATAAAGGRAAARPRRGVLARRREPRGPPFRDRRPRRRRLRGGAHPRRFRRSAALARLRDSHAEATRALERLRALLDAIAAIRAWTRDDDGRIAWANLAYARAVEAADGAAVARRSRAVRSRACARSARRRAAESGVWRAARAGGRRRRAQVVRGRRGRAPRPARPASPTIFPSSRSLARRDGAPRRRLFAHARPIVDRGGDLRPRQAADLLQRRLSPDLVARPRLSRSAADRRRDSRPAAREAPVAGAGRLPQLEGAGARRLSGDRADRERLAPARRAGAARRRQPQSAGRRHLSLRRRDAELRARLAGQRADPRAGRDARRAEGRRGGVRRRRADEADQSGLRRDVALRPGARRRPAAYRRGRAAAARRCSTTGSCGTGCARAIVGLPDERRGFEMRGRAQGRPGARLRRRCRCPTARRC